MSIPKLRTILALSFACANAAFASPIPMEPAERTLFVFVHGINPRSAGAIEGDMDGKSDFCVDNKELLGRASFVWLRDLDDDETDRSLFCSLQKKLFGQKYSLRAFTDPGETPVVLAHELGDRTWKDTVKYSESVFPRPSILYDIEIHSHVTDAMRRYLKERWDSASARKKRFVSLSSFEKTLLDLHPSAAPSDLRSLFAAQPDSIPSRVVVFAHSMGGLTTREYMTSDFYNGDLDKVVTYDTPHRGSWVAKYNQDGDSSVLKYFILGDGLKLAFGAGLLALHKPWADLPGTVYTVSGAASTSSKFGTYIGGYIANRFTGKEEGNRYLTPDDGRLKKLNNQQLLPCEGKGCRVPSFILHGVDGVLAPDDPDKFLGTGLLGCILPLEAVDAAQASIMAYSRNWPVSMSLDQKLGSAFVASNFAFAGWNYTQHGSLVVPSNSSRADGIPFLARPEVRRKYREVDWHKDVVSASSQLNKDLTTWSSSITGLSGIFLAAEALSATSEVIPSLSTELTLGKIALLLSYGLLFDLNMGAYSHFAAPSHNAPVWLNATNRSTDTVYRSDKTKHVLSFTQAEYDLYEAPFAQIAAERGVNAKSDSVLTLRMNTGKLDSAAYGIAITPSQFQDIRYEAKGWENRWAVREESHVPVQDYSTRVRQVVRRNLPVEILTTTQISELEFQIDDLRPDLMEQMEIGLNWGKHSIVWDRDHDAQGNPIGTFTVRHFLQGENDTTWKSVPNPIDAYGRWRVPLRTYIPSHLQVLMDGQNLLSVSLMNHVGKFSAQSQYLTFQATPPLVTMAYPRPYHVVSDPSAPARFRANLLYYGGIILDTAGAAWSLTRGNREILPSDERKIPGLTASDTVQNLVLPMAQAFGSDSDGLWNLALRIQSMQDASKQNGSPAMRRFPFWLDRTAPVFDVVPEPHVAGESWRFHVTWSDLPSELANVVQLVRLRVKDSTGSIVAELPPFEFVAGGSRLVVWDGMAHDDTLRDGRYSLVVEGKDGSVPSDTVEAKILELRKELYAGIDSGAAIWTPRRDSMWKVLRALPLMNWGSDSARFVLDRTPPRTELQKLSDTVIGGKERLRIPMRIFDAGAASMRDSVRLRITFRDSAGKRAFTTGLTIAVTSLDSLHPDTSSFMEGTDAAGRLPDGQWTISVVSSDPDGNLDTVVLPGIVRIDRAPPVIAYATPSHSYISSKASTITGSVGLDIRGASTVTAVWKTPTGTNYPANLTKTGEGMWTVSYPDVMRSAKGTWVLEVTATDATGNSTRTSTFVQVDLNPPRLEVPAAIQGPVVLKGLAMDPELDEYAFVSYELSWREAGSETWRRDGMRVPRGRGVDSTPWRSFVEQSAEGVLGFWDPPTGAGSVVLRVSVTDDSGRSSHAQKEGYVVSRDSATFSVKLAAAPESLVAGVGANLGFDIISKAGQKTYDAQAVLVDGRNTVLWGSWPKGLKTSALEGRPAKFQEGTLHLWREKDSWNLRATGACRSFQAILQTWSSDSIPVACPKSWKCRQDTLPDASYSVSGDTFQVNRIVTWDIPSGSRDSMVWSLAKAGRISFSPKDSGMSCAASTGCQDSVAGSPYFLAPGELRQGTNSTPECIGTGAIPLNPGQGSYSGQWDGFRQNGNWPDGASAVLEADVWEVASGRVVHARLPLPLKSAALRLGARSQGGVVLAADAPVAQTRAALDLSVEGRGAVVTTRILQNGTVVRMLEGSGTWREGRPASLPYRLEWDGTDDKGLPVSTGTYTFQVEAEGLKAEAKVVVGGSPWKSDSTLKLSFAPGEAEWSATLNVWKLAPPPLLKVGTGVEAGLSGGVFSYEAQYKGRQSVIAYKTVRPSLMVRRKRDRVKYGLLWKITTMEEIWTPGALLTTGEMDGMKREVSRYLDGGVVDIGRGETVSREIGVTSRTGECQGMFKMADGPHKVEYVAVPLSVYTDLSAQGITSFIWENAKSKRFTHGSFTINGLNVVPTYGDSDTRASFRSTFAQAPLPPRECAPGQWNDLDGDSVFSHEEWLKGSCKEARREQNDISPNRNLIWFGVRPDKTILLKMPSYISKHSATGRFCSNTENTEFSFVFDIKVPDEFFDAKLGVDNLANRLLRFDAANKYLFDSDGFLKKDGYDNDANGLIDDAAERIGPMTPFETRTYHWRPMKSDPTKKVVNCAKSTWSSTQAVFKNNQWVSLPPSDSGWIRIGEVGPYAPLSNLHSQTWLRQTPEACSTVAILEATSNILDDKLNFYEGDHDLQKDSLLLWFENNPEQGSASFVATVRQGDSVWEVDSRSHGDAKSPLRLRLERVRRDSIESVEGYPSYLQEIIRRRLEENALFRTKPVQFTVGMRSEITDQSSVSGDLVRIAWPLDSATWDLERKRIESNCAMIDPSDPAPCRRLFAAASGVRFGLGDSLDPKADRMASTSSAQQNFFALRSSGIGFNPDGLPSGRIPTSTSSVTFTGTLRPDSIGRSTFTDTIHFRATWDSLLAGIDSLHATPKADGFEISGPDANGLVKFTGQSAERWSLNLDPRMGGRSRLGRTLRWKQGSLSEVVRLDSLYRLSAAPLGSNATQEAGLFLESVDGTLSPNSSVLSQVSLVSPRVAWRDGTDASPVFEIQGMLPILTGYPEGLRLGRTFIVRRLPEWIAVRGAVASGSTYRIGWASTEGGWRSLTDSVVSTCPADSVVYGSCDLGLLDIAGLPAQGRLLLRVGTAGTYRFHGIPFLRGSTQSGSASGIVRSVFGDAQVVFPEGSLTGKSEAERTFSVRVLAPGETGLGTSSGVEVTGPVLEILPSQSFSGTTLPEIVLRLPRASFRDGDVEKDPASVRLYKVDASTGTVVALGSQTRLYLCDGATCASSAPWTEVEFHARASSFSHFALLPLGVPDSRLWSVSVTPEASTDSIRRIAVSGVDSSKLEVFWDDDHQASDASDPTPPRVANVTWSGNTGSVRMASDSVAWLVVRRRDGGLARTFRLERFAESFVFRSLAADTIHAGRAGSEISIPYQANHRGQLRLVARSGGKDVAWASSKMEGPSGHWRLALPPEWEELPSVVGTRLVATDAGGCVMEVDGPVLVFDRTRPVATLEVTTRRVRGQWILRIVPTGTDDNLATVALSASLDGQYSLGHWGQLGTRELVIDDAQFGSTASHQVEVALEVLDRSGNRAEASWNGSLVAPELTSLLWLVPSGSGQYGWQVDDLGRHRLGTRIEGLSNWSDDALGFASSGARVVTDPIADPGTAEATLELLGIWDTTATLLERVGGWAWRREGRDVVFRQGATECRWVGIFGTRARWMHLALAMNATEAVLYVDGRPQGVRTRSAAPLLEDVRPWSTSGGGEASRLALARVWAEGFDSAQIAIWRSQAIGIDSVSWIEAESMTRDGGRIVPHCELPSRLAFASGDSARWLSTTLTGPMRVGLAGRWIADASVPVVMKLDGSEPDTFLLEEKNRWGSLGAWASGSGPSNLVVPSGSHQVSFRIPAGAQFDGLALVFGEGRIDRWELPAPVVAAPTVEVLVRDESPSDTKYLKPRIIVKNLSSKSLPGYKLHVQMREDAWSTPVVETWWPSPLSWSLFHDHHGLFTWSMDRSQTVVPAGQSDFGTSGVSIGFHHADWSMWNRTDDPSWDSSWAKGTWTRGSGIPVFSNSGQLLSDWSCRDGAELTYPTKPAMVDLRLTNESPLVVEGITARIEVPPEGTWNWNSTVVGISPLDGQTLSGKLVWNGTTFPLSGWWQQITIPNASRSELTLLLDLGTARKVQLQKWQQ